MDALIKAIGEANTEEIDDLLDAVIRRKRILYPEWEIIYYSRRKDEGEDPETLLAFLSGRG